MSKAVWNDNLRLWAAMAVAAAGLFAAALAVIRPAWLFPAPYNATRISLPEPYSSGKIFEGHAIDTEPTHEELDQLLEEFSANIQQKAKNLGLSPSQCADLGAVAMERVRGMLDPDIQRDHETAVKRGLQTPADALADQIAEYSLLIGRLELAPFGSESAILVPRKLPGARKTHQLLTHIDFVADRMYSLPVRPEYDQTGIGADSPTIELLFPVRIPVLDLASGQFTKSPSAVVVLGFEFSWAGGDRQLWVPQAYRLYEYGNALDDDKYRTGGFPMAF